ncbi:MAG: hypothetical protein KDN19_10370 [Verrucomicrobiae bacterium]|nr:hypothetical protein [Verrucomicrobiae bacterium]
MAHRLRQFQRRHGRYLREGDLSELAQDSKAPLSAWRSVAGFFEEFREPTLPATGDRSCGDLACMLALGKEAPNPADGGEVLACLGRCHHAPVRVDRHGELHFRDTPNTVIGRCLAPESRLTRPSWEKETDACVAILGREKNRAAAIRKRLKAVAGLDRHRKKRGRTLTERWFEVADAKAEQRFLVCHADAGNPGATGSAWLLQYRAHAVIDGMVLASWLTGAKEGVICVHHDLPEVFTAVEEALSDAIAAGKLREGQFEISVIATFGSHVGGEETALLNAIEGKRGEVRIRPPEPETSGVFGLPTVIETAETFALLPGWLASEEDMGHRLVTLTPPFSRPGVVEIDASVSLRGVSREGTSFLKTKNYPRALLLGGPFGSVVFSEDWDLRLDAEILAERDFSPGHWGLAPLPMEADLSVLVRGWLEFAARENCGKCAPCRLGPLAALEMLDSHDLRGRHRFREILETIAETSLCGFGRDFPRPLRQLIEKVGIDWIYDGPPAD